MEGEGIRHPSLVLDSILIGTDIRAVVAIVANNGKISFYCPASEVLLARETLALW